MIHLGFLHIPCTKGLSFLDPSVQVNFYFAYQEGEEGPI